MPPKSRFVVSEGSIKKHFASLRKRAFLPKDIEVILEKNRVLWNLPVSTTVKAFTAKLLERGVLVEMDVDFEGEYPAKIVYVSEGYSAFEVATTIFPRSYISHFSAAYIHGATSQVPKIINVSREQSLKPSASIREMTQAAIDVAFSKPQRLSGVRGKFDNLILNLHNSAFSDRLGVFSLEGISVTNLERTLIDIAVRPDYAGGVPTVIEIYRNAKELGISIRKLVAILKKLGYKYPYHQAIGFYLDAVGFEESKLKELFELEMKYDFYLGYGMKDPSYSSKWKIYFPKGIL
jgi:predicted transcriptional regulator of viral defense system